MNIKLFHEGAPMREIIVFSLYILSLIFIRLLAIPVRVLAKTVVFFLLILGLFLLTPLGKMAKKASEGTIASGTLNDPATFIFYVFLIAFLVMILWEFARELYKFISDPFRGLECHNMDLDIESMLAYPFGWFVIKCLDYAMRYPRHIDIKDAAMLQGAFLGLFGGLVATGLIFKLITGVV